MHVFGRAKKMLRAIKIIEIYILIEYDRERGYTITVIKIEHIVEPIRSKRLCNEQNTSGEAKTHKFV